jgi:hypothetical protein
MNRNFGRSRKRPPTLMERGGPMDNVLSLQRLDTLLMFSDGLEQSGRSICCEGSTQSMQNCCNAPPDVE